MSDYEEGGTLDARRRREVSDFPCNRVSTHDCKRRTKQDRAEKCNSKGKKLRKMPH